jgi:predicted Zn-dependent peptidase
MQKLAKMRMLSEILFGASSSFSEELYRSGIISSPLYINSEHTERISYLQLIADCQQPDLFFSRFCQFTEEKKLCGISEEEFERNRRSAYGSFIMSLEYSESVADLLTEYAADKINLFSYAETMLTITKSQIEELMFSLFRLPNYCLASLDPIKNRKE